ncbi:MAG: zinc ribbon domain-containing protein [bacterium]|nr:zinc ribbon domain-containing protein [bacterium]
MNAEHGHNYVPLNDEEISRLMDPGLDPEERRDLIERLENDPHSAEILALAGSKPSADSLHTSVVEKVLKKVRESAAETGLCSFCAGDLMPGAPYCPHCGAQVIGNPLKCMTCGSPVREGSAYCPRCGSFFQSTDKGRADPLQNQWFLPVLGIVSIFVAILVRSMNVVFLVFLAIGLISLGAWGGEVWENWRRKKLQDVSAKEVEKEEERTHRKSG